MPTNLLRRPASDVPNATTLRKKRSTASDAERIVRIRMGRCAIRARLFQTQTADRIWLTLPIFGFAEPWGDAFHFETHVETGRERGAVVNGRLGELYFWAEDDRIIIPFGPTPISRPGEIRLPRPCNPFAVSLDDLSVLKRVRPADKVVVEAATD